ncbi:MAG: lysine--tRNA ligase [Methanocellales archaeon]|nr:lysine--tRNA ligase [Methanocellales archaeon]
MSENVHWSDVIAEDVLKRGNKHVVATGITPSGSIHIGNMREVAVANAVCRALRDHGADARLIYIADTYDPLRKLYPFLPEGYVEHIGKPLSEIPDPDGCCPSYAEHFLRPFLNSLERLGIEIEVYKADYMYKSGMYTDTIKTALENRDKIAKILSEIAGTSISSSWSPFNPLCEQCGRIKDVIVKGYMGNSVDYECICGHRGVADFSKGGGKLTWRVDWPARWKILDITVEPFGKDHAVAGGSYDTGVQISKDIYGHKPPYPIPFEHIFLKGRGKMSSSTGTLVSIQEMLDILPPEVLMHLFLRTNPEKHIEFDPGLPLLNLIDEYDRIHGWQISFRHMVTIVQTAQDFDQILEVLRRSGYGVSDLDAIRQRSINAKNWLSKFAPPSVKFKVQETLPVGVKKLSQQQRFALRILADEIGSKKTAEDLHNEIYEIAEEAGIDSSDVFKAIYVAILGKSSGPRAGWFLLSLDGNFIRERLRDASKA